MLHIQVLGVKEAVAALGKFSAQLDAALKKGLTHAAMVVVKAAKKNIPGAATTGKKGFKDVPAVPDHLTSRSGHLKNSITYEVVGLEAHVGTNLKYAAIHEFGGKTGPHIIRPKTAKMLRFMIGDNVVYARSVKHPGSVIPKRPYLQPALDSSQGEIQKRMTEAIEKVLP